MFIYIMTDKPDYNNGKIFIISSESTDKIYYGATVLTLDDVLHKHTHKSGSASESGPIVKYGNAIIQHVEFFPCSSVEELEDRHAYYIMNNRDKCINKRIPGTARRKAGGKKAYDDNIREKYNELNKKQILEKGRKQHECDICGGTYQHRHKARHLRSFKHNNPDKKIIDYVRVSHNCNICGGSYQTRHKDRHFASIKHNKHVHPEEKAPLFSEDPFTLTF
jgi:hypothetical protein